MANFDKKDQKKRETVKKFEVQRKFLKHIITYESGGAHLSYEYMLNLNSLASETSPVQVVQRCV